MNFFSLEKRMYVSFVLKKRRKKNVFIFLWYFSRREFFERKRNFYFLFNSDSFWIVLKLLKTTFSFSYLLAWVGSTHLGTQTQLQHLAIQIWTTFACLLWNEIYFPSLSL